MWTAPRTVTPESRRPEHPLEPHLDLDLELPGHPFDRRHRNGFERTSPGKVELALRLSLKHHHADQPVDVEIDPMGDRLDKVCVRGRTRTLTTLLDLEPEPASRTP